MEFKKYQHVERFGTLEVKGITEGTCFIFPKIDGTNASVWLDKTTDKLICASRRRVLSVDDDNRGFCKYIMDNYDKYYAFFSKHPLVRLYGEWLVPHTLKTYRDNAWRKFYVFDIFFEDEKEKQYIEYEIYKNWLEQFGVDYIPAMCKIDNPLPDRLYDLVEENKFLIKDNHGSGEGIVIKNYDYKNKFGRTTWAKIVKNEFKDKHSSNKTREVKERKAVEQDIVNDYVTTSLIEKEYAKIVNEKDGWSSKFIPRLLSTVYYCLITEEMWNIVKKYKNPLIDFKLLHHFTVNKIKEEMKYLF